jgi:hypothetical protein
MWLYFVIWYLLDYSTRTTFNELHFGELDSIAPRRTAVHTLLPTNVCWVSCLLRTVLLVEILYRILDNRGVNNKSAQLSVK